jgi:hypothetical protein
MVAIGDDHDHGEGQVCPACRFREALAEFLEESHSDGREEWHWAVGDLRQSMHAALLALDAIEAQPFDNDADPDDEPAVDAAAAIVAVGAEIEQLWQALLGDGEQAD